MTILLYLKSVEKAKYMGQTKALGPTSGIQAVLLMSANGPEEKGVG